MIYTSVLQQGNRLLVRERDERGRDHSRREDDYRPFFFLGSNKPTEYTDVLRQRQLQRKEFDSIKEARDFTTEYVKSSNVSVYGMSTYPYQFIQNQYNRDQIQDKSKILKNIIDIEVDSENGFPKPELAESEVNAITLYDSFDDVYYCWALYDWSEAKSELRDDLKKKVRFRKCENELELLALFMQRWTTNYPDIISGWNSDGFDMLYLYNRLTKLCGEKVARRLSPWGICRIKEFEMYGKKQMEVNIVGIAMLDYLRLYKKYELKMRESYKLGYIGEIELKEGKISYEEAASLYSLARVNPQKFVDYNIKDVDLVVRLDQKRRMFDLAIDLAYYAGINFEDTFSPIKIWNGMIYHHLLKQNMVIPFGKFDEDAEKGDQFEGAFVKTPPKGLFKNVISFDLTSLYPMIVRQWNLGIDAIQENSIPGLEGVQFVNVKEKFLRREIDVRAQLKAANSCLAMNGTVYSNENDSFMRDLMAMLFADRKKSKTAMLAAKKKLENIKEGHPEYDELKAIVAGMSTREQAMKVILNSGYGALGNQWFKFFDTRIAEAVTITGQVVTQWVQDDINDYLNKILGGAPKDRCLYIDTDSTYFHMEEFVKKFLPESQWDDDAKVTAFLDKVCEKISKDVIEPSYERLRDLTNCSEQRMEMKREAIASAAFWKAKKKYAMRVLNSEGISYLDDPEIKIMGLEAISSKIPEFSKKAIKQAIVLMLTKDNPDLLKYIDQFRKEFMSMSIEDIAAGTGVNGIGEYTDYNGKPKKGATQQARAAIVYNLARTRYGIDMTHPAISDGEKIKFVPLKLPNPIKENVIGFTQFFPKEFNELDKYIDRDALFVKNFLGPVSGMTDAVGWQYEEVNDLSDFFS